GLTTRRRGSTPRSPQRRCADSLSWPSASCETACEANPAIAKRPGTTPGSTPTDGAGLVPGPGAGPGAGVGHDHVSTANLLELATWELANGLLLTLIPCWLPHHASFSDGLFTTSTGRTALG